MNNMNNNDEVHFDDLFPLFQRTEQFAPYEILISVKTDDFNRRFNSVSTLYRILSNSNQSVGISSPTKNHTNRKWWRYHFSGGYYNTYTCNEYKHIHFVLDMNPDTPLPSELQVKMRILKGFKGYKPTIRAGVNNDFIKLDTLRYQECYTETQTIGDRYNENTELPF